MGTELAILPWAFLGLGAVFAVLGLLGLRSTLVRRRRWARVPGVVVATRLRNVGGEGSMVQAQLSYEYGGSARTAWNPHTATSGLGPQVGRHVDVLVNPERPDQAVLAAGSSRHRGQRRDAGPRRAGDRRRRGDPALTPAAPGARAASPR